MPLTLKATSPEASSPAEGTEFAIGYLDNEKMVCGRYVNVNSGSFIVLANPNI